MDFSSHVQQWIEAFSYPAVLLLLTSAGLGAPVSEDLVMLAGGMVIGRSGGNLPLMMLTAYVGVLAGDSLLWRIGHKLGPRAVNVRGIRRILTPGRVEWARRHFQKHGAKTVFVARFAAGLRAVTFLSAGTTGLPYRRFLLADGLAALIIAPLMTWLGWRFGSVVLKDVHAAFRWILVGIGVLLVAAIAHALWRKRRVRPLPPPTPEDVELGRRGTHERV